jgi:hypothetical protein
MAAFNKFNCFVGDVGLKKHDLNADTLRIYLTNAAPSASNTVFGTPAEITAGNGYTAGGADIQNTYSQTSGTGTLTGVDVVWTASGGTIGPFRYVVLYNDDSATNALIGWWDYGSSITLNDTETFTTDFGASVLTLA